MLPIIVIVITIFYDIVKSKCYEKDIPICCKKEDILEHISFSNLRKKNCKIGSLLP